MTGPASSHSARRRDVYSLEADAAYFEARLSFAAEAPESAYQRAQIKTYQTLGALIGATLDRLKARRNESRAGRHEAA